MEDERPSRTEAIVGAISGSVVMLGALIASRALPIPSAFLYGVALAALGSASWVPTHRYAGRAAATMLLGLLLGSGALVAGNTLTTPYHQAALPVAMWIAGTAAIQASTHARRTAAPVASMGVALLGLGVAVAWPASALMPETVRLRVAIVGALSLGLVALAVRLAIAKRWPRFVPSPAGTLVVSALIVSYLAYRPLAATRVTNLILYEWTLGVGIGVLLMGRLRKAARDASVHEAWSGSARRHEQDAAPIYDPRMPPLAMSVQRYLETGNGFEGYRAALERLAPHAPPPFRKALQGARAVQGRGRAAKAARRERHATHEAFMRLLNHEVTKHGDTAPGLRTHP